MARASGIRTCSNSTENMEAYEEWLRDQAQLIQPLTKDLNRERVAKGTLGSESSGIRIKLTGEEDPLLPSRGNGSQKMDEVQTRKRKINEEDDDDAGEASIKQVFKKTKLNECNGINKTGEDFEAWIEELEDFFALRTFSKEAKAKIAILQLRTKRCKGLVEIVYVDLYCYKCYCMERVS